MPFSGGPLRIVQPRGKSGMLTISEAEWNSFETTPSTPDS